MILYFLALVGLLSANFLPTEYLGLSRDFTFDITVGNKDRLIFKAQASEIQSFTFSSEGDLSDNIAFYLYGIWIDNDGPHWSSVETGAKFFLVKTRNKLPVERYDVTRMVQNGAETEAERNIKENLKKLCESLYDLGAIFAKESEEPFNKDFKFHDNVEMLVPDIPKLFAAILAKTLEPFNTRIDSEMLPVIRAGKNGKLARINAPQDFNYTWQIGEGTKETQTLTLEYDRGHFRCLVDTSYASFKDLINVL